MVTEQQNDYDVCIVMTLMDKQLIFNEKGTKYCECIDFNQLGYEELIAIEYGVIGLVKKEYEKKLDDWSGLDDLIPTF